MIFCGSTLLGNIFIRVWRLTLRELLDPSCFSLFSPFYLFMLYFCTVVATVYICSTIVYFSPFLCFGLDGSQWFAPTGFQPWKGDNKVYYETPVACSRPCRQSSSEPQCRLSFSPPARSLDSPHRRSRSCKLA